MSTQKEIEIFLAKYPPDVRELAFETARMLESALPGAQATVDEPAKLLGYSYGPGYQGVVCTLLVSKSGVKIGVFEGAKLPDPRQLMKGEGKVHRHVPITTIGDLKLPGLKPLLRAALAACRERNKGAI
jgi:hypothetical protein